MDTKEMSSQTHKFTYERVSAVHLNVLFKGEIIGILFDRRGNPIYKDWTFQFNSTGAIISHKAFKVVMDIVNALV